MSRAQTPAKARAKSRRKLAPPTPLRTGSVLTGKNLITVLCVLLAGITMALYSPVIGYSFIQWDADDLVTGNPHIQADLDRSTIKWVFTSPGATAWK